MASDNPVGWKGKEIAGSIIWTDLHSWHVLPFSCQQDPSVREGRSRFVFLWEETDPLSFQGKASGKPKKMQPLLLTCSLC